MLKYLRIAVTALSLTATFRAVGGRRWLEGLSRRRMLLTTKKGLLV